MLREVPAKDEGSGAAELELIDAWFAVEEATKTVIKRVREIIEEQEISERLVGELSGQIQGGACVYEWTYDKEQGEVLCRRMGLMESTLAKFAIRDHDRQCIIAAAQCFGDLGTQAEAAVPLLIELLGVQRNYETGDGLLRTRSEIALALGRIGDPQAIQPLIDVLQSEDETDYPSYEREHLHALIEDGPTSWGSKGTSFGAVAEALGMFGPDAREAVPYLLSLLNDGPAEGAESLVNSHETAVSISGRSRNPPCGRAAQALAAIGDPRAIPALVKALNNPKCERWAVSALNMFGSDAREALPMLETILQRESEGLEGDEWSYAHQVRDVIHKIRRTSTGSPDS